MKLLVSLAAGITLFSTAAQAQIHAYEFTTGLGDSVAGGATLTPSVSPGNPTAAYTVTGGNYVFDTGAGLYLGSQLPGSVYTITMRVAFDSISGYRKLVSFGNISTDLGLYDLSGGLSLFNVAVSPVNTDFVAGQFSDVQISRNAAGIVSGYVNGVLRITYDDSATGYYTPTSGGTTSGFWFLRDDTAQNGEQSSGQADYIRIYDTATVTPAAVPEPASWALMILGFSAVGYGLRRQPAARRAHAA